MIVTPFFRLFPRRPSPDFFFVSGIHEEGTKLHHPTDFVTTAFVWHGTWIAAVVTAIVVIINVVHRSGVCL